MEHRVLGMQLHVMSHIDTLRSSKDANHPCQALGFEGHAVKIAPGVFATLLGFVSRLPGNYPTLDRSNTMRWFFVDRESKIDFC